MSKLVYPLSLLRDDRRELKQCVENYDPEKNYYEDDDLERWKREIIELEEAIELLTREKL